MRRLLQLALVAPSAMAFALISRPQILLNIQPCARPCCRSLSMQAQSKKENDTRPLKYASTSTTTRATFLSSSLASVASLATVAFSPPASASSDGITGCPPSSQKFSNCVSTASIKQIDNYAPPWTFECSPQEAFARLKGAIASEPTLSVAVVDDEALYVTANAERNALIQDELEFLVRADDKVVIFRSAEKGGGEAAISDFGANRKRLDDLRRRAAVFGVMGGGLTADSYVGDQGKGPLGQLKAFYGLQSGSGFQGVLNE